MPLYETVFIARQDIPAQEAEALAEKYSGIVSEHGGSVARREYWGLRTLAYRIKKNRKGHYTMFHLDAPPEAVSEMERNMRLDENILRYLTIRSDTLDDKPSIIMQGRVAREERTRHGKVEVGVGTAKSPINAPSSKTDDLEKKDETIVKTSDEVKKSSINASSSKADDPEKKDETIVKTSDEVKGESV